MALRPKALIAGPRGAPTRPAAVLDHIGGGSSLLPPGPRYRWLFGYDRGMGFFAWIAVGLIAGLVARIIVRPDRRLGCLGTIAVGLAGSLIGGTIANSVSGDGFDLAASGIVGSIIGTIFILALARLRNPPPPRPG